jgi:hypothetical protein
MTALGFVSIQGGVEPAYPAIEALNGDRRGRVLAGLESDPSASRSRLSASAWICRIHSAEPSRAATSLSVMGSSTPIP